MARVVLIGAHGKVAQLAIPQLRDAGHEVSGVIRKADQEQDVRSAGAEPVVADVESMDTDALGELVAGHDVVVWSAGAGGGSPERTYAVDRDAAIRTVDAAVAAGVPRFVMVSYFGAGPDHGVPEDNGFFAYAEAKAAADEHLRATDLAWTILQPSTLTDDEATARIDAEADSADSASRGNVAAVIAAVVDAPDATARRTIPFNDGDTPVEEAVASA
jgi:uncharacterized protein YbjT (DUF2867 family)